MHVVMAVTNKEERVNLRIRPDVKLEALAAAEMSGLTLSGLILKLLKDTINDEKHQRPQLFADALRQQKERNPDAFRNQFERPVVRAKIRSKGKSKQNRG